MLTDEKGFTPEAVMTPLVYRVEVGIFLMLIVPSMVLSFFAVSQGTVGFMLTASAAIFRDVGLVALILFFVWRDREPLRDLGLRWSRRSWREVALGVVLFVPFFFGTNWLERLFVSLGLSLPKASNPISVPSSTTTGIVMGTLLVVVVAFSEELIFRGYLIDRFRGSGLGTASAVALSTVVFALGHGYEGTAGIATVGVMGLVFALVYLWRKSLTASMTIHFLQDFLVVVAVPLLFRR